MRHDASTQWMAPTLTTKRLRLRPIELGDYEKFEKFLASSRSELMGGPYKARAAWGVFCHEIALWNLFGYGGLSIELQATGECVGLVEINDGPLFPERELGWQVFQEHEGNGYITEAAQAYLHWAFEKRKLPTLVSYIDPENSRSIAVAERLNGLLDHNAPKQDPEDLVYRYHP